jgi:hypothetical protein
MRTNASAIPPFKRFVFWGGCGGGALAVPPSLGLRLNMHCPFSGFAHLTRVDYPRFLQFRRASCAIGETYCGYEPGAKNLPAGKPHSARKCLIIRRGRPHRGRWSAASRGCDARMPRRCAMAPGGRRRWQDSNARRVCMDATRAPDGGRRSFSRIGFFL